MMFRSLTQFLPLLLAGLAPITCASAQNLNSSKPSDEAKAGLEVTLRLTKPDGTQIERASVGDVFRIAIKLKDAATNRPAGGLHPLAWLRSVDKSNLPCHRAAEIYNRTGRLPRGSIDLNGVLVGVLQDDSHFSFVDPRLDLATSNLIAVARLDTMPSQFVADPTGVGVTIIDQGKPRSVLINGLLRTSTAERETFHHYEATQQSVWVATDDALLRLPLSERDQPIGFASRISRLRDAALPPAPDSERKLVSDAPDILAITADGLITLVTPAGRTSPLGRLDGIRDAVYSPMAAGAFVLTGDDTVRLLRAGGRTSNPLRLPAPAEHLAISSDERLALAWSTKATAISFIDGATMTLTGAVSFDRPIREVAVAGSTAYALLADLSAVIVINFSSLVPGETPRVENVRLGPETVPPHGSGPYLARLPSGRGVLALHRPTQTVFVLQARHGEGMPPMTAFRLKGGLPRGLAILDRSVREVSFGQYETNVLGHAAGPWELVVTTGLAGLSTCFRIDVEGPREADRAGTLAIRVERSQLDEAGNTELVLYLDTDGHALHLRDTLPFILTALDRPWQIKISANRVEGTNRYVAPVRLPGPGQFPLLPAFALPRGNAITPGLAVVEK